MFAEIRISFGKVHEAITARERQLKLIKDWGIGENFVFEKQKEDRVPKT